MIDEYLSYFQDDFYQGRDGKKCEFPGEKGSRLGESVRGEAEAQPGNSGQAEREPVRPDLTGTLDMTVALLAPLSIPSDKAQPLSARQLGGLERLYVSAGAPLDVARKAVNKWEAAQFTPTEYKRAREVLRKKLRSRGGGTW
ncbi:MAG: hypothetical protein PQJ60_03050 [Spirochaetales bacterium]|nr:hypothetical protein [Spirochaetales bacterium]